MPAPQGEKIKQDILNRYFERTRKSREFDAKARTCMPGGDTRGMTYFKPYPTYMVEGRGCRLYDVDGHEYLDFINNFTSLIHGHAHPELVAAAEAQARVGAVMGAPSEIQIRHAEHLCDRVSSLDRVRYTNSGTEATMYGIRAARGFTGKDAILKMDGGYHGSHDYAEVNQMPDHAAEGPPRTILEPGIPQSIAKDVYVSPFNDLEVAEDILKKHGNRIAAIILEPVLAAGGALMPKPGFLKGMRELADRYDVLLIFDEIVTFRYHAGGWQGIEEIRPDLTTLGKIIGGCYPVGAFGGREDVMRCFDPNTEQPIAHSGTFTANNNTLGVGLRALELYPQKEADRLNELGDRMRDGIIKALKDAGLRAQCTGYGSIVGLHWTTRELNNARGVIKGIIESGDIQQYIHYEMMNQGIYAATRGFFALSTPMTTDDVDHFVQVMKNILDIIKPYVKETCSDLVE